MTPDKEQTMSDERWSDEELSKACDHAAEVHERRSPELSEHLEAAARRLRRGGEVDREAGLRTVENALRDVIPSVEEMRQIEKARGYRYPRGWREVRRIVGWVSTLPEWRLPGGTDPVTAAIFKAIGAPMTSNPTPTSEVKDG